MAIRLKWVAIATLTLLLSLRFFKTAMLPGRCKSSMAIPIKRIRGQEKVGLKHYRERIDEALNTYSTHDQTPLEIDEDGSYHHGRTLRQEVDEAERENGGPRMPSTQTKVLPKFETERETPRGPDGQHHAKQIPEGQYGQEHANRIASGPDGQQYEKQIFGNKMVKHHEQQIDGAQHGQHRNRNGI